MEIFVINLKRSVHRRTKMEEALNELQLDYEFFEGIDGYKLTQKEIESYIDPQNKYPRSFKPGEIGCFLSHYAVFKKIVDEKIPYALILEDDVELSENLPGLLKKLEQLIQQGEVISLYASFPELCKLYKEGTVDAHYSFVKPYDGELVVGNVAYIMTYSAAKNMVSRLIPINNVIDDWRFWCRQGYIKDFKIVFPHPIDLTDNYSDIHESYGGLSLRIKKYLVNRSSFFAERILTKRKLSRLVTRLENIRIDGVRPEKIFY